MILNRENLKKYLELENELKRINRKLEYYAMHPLQASHGVVKGSMNSFPYTECRISVGAPDLKAEREREKKVQKLVRELCIRKKEYEDFRFRIDVAIEEVEDMELRQILQWKYIERQSDTETGKLLGYDRSTISKKLDRFFENQDSHNSHSVNGRMILSESAKTNQEKQERR